MSLPSDVPSDAPSDAGASTPTVTMTLALPTPEATRRLGHCLSGLAAGSTVLLQGDLGSGKTTLAQGLGAGLGIEAHLASPTFALLHEYHDGRVPLYHFDLYRLSPEQVSALAPEVYWDGSEAPLGIVLIEWCDRLPYQPERAITIRLTPASGSRGNPAAGRVATLSAAGEDADLAAIAQAFEAASLAAE